VPDGTVTVSWSFAADAQGERRLSLAWKESGGPPVELPHHKGFGHMVMDRITGPALGGSSEIHFEREGVRWRLDVPADDVIRVKEEAIA
jgi:two-component sensor histidine kinase